MRPVNIESLPLYSLAVKEPMDVGTMQQNLRKGDYDNDTPKFMKHLHLIPA